MPLFVLRGYYRISDPKKKRKREKKRKRLVRKFMRERRELLLLNKTLKYLITVPVISVEGNGIGAMFSSFEAFEIASKKGIFGGTVVLTAFANFQPRDS